MAVQVMRLHFVVHTYLNMTMSDGQGALMVGNRVAERTRANIQSHLVTIDKQVMRMKVQEAFNPDQKTAASDIKTFGRREGILISDVDDFMPRGNPFVNFPNEDYIDADSN